MNLYLTLALRYLWGRKMRSLLTVVAIMLGVMIIFGLNSILPAVQASFNERLSVTAHQIDLIVTHNSGGVFDMALVEIVRQQPGVAAASPALEMPAALPTEFALPTVDGKGTIRTLDVTGWEPESSYQVIPFRPVQGRWLAPNAPDEMMVHQNFIERTGLGLGDTLVLPAADGTMTFRLVGVLPRQSLFGPEDIYVSLQAAQKMFHLPDQINGIPAQFETSVPAGEEEALRQAVIERLGPGFEAGFVDPGGSEWTAAVQMGQMIFTLFGVLAMAMGGFVMLNTFRAAVLERQHDIGMLRAIGASRRTVLTMILAEGLVQGVAGTALGMLLGALLLNALLALASPVWEQFFNAPIARPDYNLSTILVSVALGLGVPLLSGWIPARAASRISPLDALRPASGEAGQAGSKRRLVWTGGLALAGVAGLITGRLELSALGVLLFLIALIAASPVLVAPISAVFGRLIELIYVREGRLAQGNLARQPGRAAVTASAMMISMAILVALAGLATTVLQGMLHYLDTSMQADYLILPQALVLGQGNVGAGPQLAEQLRHVAGIEAVTTLRFTETTATSQTPPRGLAALKQRSMGTASSQTKVQVLGLDPQTYPGMSGLTFKAGRPEEAFARLREGRYLIANGILAAQFGLQVGSTVTLQTTGGAQSYTVAGIGIDYLNSKLATVYISQHNLAADYGIDSDVLLMADRAGDANAGQVQEALLAVLDTYPAFTLFSYETWRAYQVESTRSLTLPMYLLIVVLVVPSLVALANTLGINVLERTREIGMLRAVGAARRQIRRMILAESLLLSTLGLAAGIGAGLWMGYLLVAGLNMAGMVMIYTFPWTSILLAVTVSLVFGLAAAWAPARHAARIDIVAALRYE